MLQSSFETSSIHLEEIGLLKKMFVATLKELRIIVTFISSSAFHSYKIYFKLLKTAHLGKHNPNYTIPQWEKKEIFYNANLQCQENKFEKWKKFNNCTGKDCNFILHQQIREIFPRTNDPLCFQLLKLFSLEPYGRI